MSNLSSAPAIPCGPAASVGPPEPGDRGEFLKARKLLSELRGRKRQQTEGESAQQSGNGHIRVLGEEVNFQFRLTLDQSG